MSSGLGKGLYFQVLLEGFSEKVNSEDLVCDEICEAGKRLLIFRNEAAFRRWEPFLKSQATILEEGFTAGEILRLPSGVVFRAFGNSSSEKEIFLRSQGAFGSGFHPTTRLCLHLLDELKPSSGWALDLGAGTGILSLLLARKGWKVLAVEPDLQALKVLTENIKRNRLEDKIYPLCGEVSALKGPFTLIVANLYLRLLIPQASLLKALLSPAGSLILSGFLVTSLPAVRRAYAGLVVEREITHQGWAALKFTTP